MALSYSCIAVVVFLLFFLCLAKSRIICDGS